MLPSTKEFSEETKKALLQQLDSLPVQRIARLELDGVRYWAKRYDVEPVFFGHRVHSLISKLFREPIFRPTPILPGAEIMRHELDKLRKFQEAGIHTPEILHEGNNLVLLSDVGRSLDRRMRKMRTDPQLCDKVLLEWVMQIRNIHQHGLCHGRPHLRDVALDFENGTWAFIDFEQTPELVMSLEAAQARDFFLALHILTLRVSDERVLDEAFNGYIEGMPEEISRQLGIVVKTFSFATRFDGLFRRINPGKDIVRFVRTVSFLKKKLQ